MINFDDITKENIKEHNPDWLQIPDPAYRMLIIGSSRLGRTNSLFNLIGRQPDVRKTYWYVKDSFNAKYMLSINKRQAESIIRILKLLLNTLIIGMI